MEKVLEILKDAVTVQPKELRLPGSSCIQRAAELFDRRFDTKYGGFGDHPKFPQPSTMRNYSFENNIYLFLIFHANVVILDFLLKVYNRYPSSEMGENSLTIALKTLRAMANGGIHDHIAQVGGFFFIRSSVQ